MLPLGMPLPSRGTTRRLCAALVMAAMLLNACRSWHAATGSVPDAIAAGPEEVRVTLRDGAVIEYDT